MSGILSRLLGSAAAAAITDAYFNLTTLLLNTTATNGAQNNTFLDSSTNNFTITRNGNTTQGTFTPFSQTGWSNYTSAVVSNYINFTTSPGTLFQFTGDFTIECWIFPTLLGTGESLWVTNDGGSSYLAFNITTTTYDIFLNSTGVTSSITSGVNLNQWNHCAMVRSGSTVTLYTNGVSKGTITNSSTLGYANPSLNRNGGGGSSASWYMSNLRIVKGTAVYTGSTYTVPTTPLTAISGTSLLTCQSNRFIDSSSNALVATVSGTPSVQAFSPFAPTAAYSTSVVGGSGYFDGTGDYLSGSSNTNLDFGTGDFTVEMFVYVIAYPGSSISLFAGGGSGGGSNINIYVGTNGYVGATFDGVGEDAATAAGAIKTNNWQHVALVRSGNNFTIYIDGASAATGSTTNASTFYGGSGWFVGGNGAGANQYLNGYVSSVRVLKGTALYTTTFTPPTAPLTAITNTQLLLSATNAGIFDSPSKNVLETVGSAQVSTTQAKWGTTSMAFDGTGDWLFLNSSAPSPIALGGGDFTVEMWLYPNSSYSGSYAGIMDSRTTTDGAGLVYFGYTSTANQIGWKDNNTFVVTGTVTQSAWNHVAVVRESGTLKLYINGSLASSGANTTNYTVAFKYIGSSFDPFGFNGYMDDIRITRGYARYSGSTYTQPAAAFPLQ
jgi:hypothetical protein